MEKKVPFFLTRLLGRSPQNSEFGEQKGWGITADDTRFGGWGSSSSPGSTSSGSIANGWADEPSDNHYNGWAYEKPENEYNGWESSIPGDESATPEASSNGCMKVELPESVSTSNQRLLNAESFPCPPVPSAPPLPYVGSNEHHATNASNHLCLDVKNDVVSVNQIKKGNASCVVCWEAPVEGACVPCGHMSSCMPCLRQIESKQGICPVCRAKIDKVLRIYAI
ncbi:probable E3 ubiquitin-protein ligase XBOS34 [Lactuca sativa]|nr:probable E3 ubiquitin-protein ligase XBOS34 [Lactuca sativa]